MRPSVYVAGRGVVCGFGAGLQALTAAVFAGRRAVLPRVRTASFRAPTRVAGEFPPGCLPDVPEVELPTAAAVCAGREALAEAGIVDTSDIGLVLATTKAELSGLVCEGSGLALPARLARRIVDQLGLSCVHAAVSSACASGLTALSVAELRIRAGEVDRVLVVGVDALSECILAGFGGMHILDPEPCRPFDVGRRGLSLGDGAGAMLLSVHEGESVGIRIAGHGGANDAIHVTGCDRTGSGLGLAVQRALAAAAIGSRDLDLVHLHGTGTRANDASEALALATVFDGPTAPAFGTKAQTGHTLGAAGLVESLVAIAALQRAEVPANVGLEEPGVDPRLDLVRETRPLSRARRALKVNGGFGGVQQAMVFET